MTKFGALQELERAYNSFKPAYENSNVAFAWYSGIPHPLFNAVMHLIAKEDLEDRVDMFISQAPSQTPLAFWVHEQNGTSVLRDALTKRGFQSILICPLMTWSAREVPTPCHAIHKADMDIFHTILATAFHMDAVVKDGFAKLLANADAENYLVYLEGTPVGTGTLISNGKTGVIFNISVLPEYERKGCAKAMMQFLMNRALTLGLDHLVLLSSPAGEKLYLDLGFTKSFDIDIYAR